MEIRKQLKAYKEIFSEGDLLESIKYLDRIIKENPDAVILRVMKA